MKMDMKPDSLSDEFDRVLYRDLDILKSIPPRDLELTRKARVRFLEEMDSICRKNVIKNSNLRHIQQKEVKTGFRWFGKEFSPMFTQIVLAVLIALSVLGGGSAGAVYASQSSIPGDFLYPVKLLSEDIQLDWTAEPEQQLELNLEMAQERLFEMEQAKLVNREIPEETLKGMYNHLETSLQLGARLYADNPEAQQKLNERVRTQVQNLEQFGTSEASPEMQQLHQQIHEKVQVQERVNQEDEVVPEQDAPADDDGSVEVDSPDQGHGGDQAPAPLKAQDQLQDCTPVAPATGQPDSVQPQNQGDSSNMQSGNPDGSQPGSDSDNGDTNQKGKN